jgi:hypothetical protein
MPEAEEVNMARKKTKESARNDAAAHLLAAEANLLHSCGWIPIGVSGRVRWLDPINGGVSKTQHQAIDLVKQRMDLL